MAEREGLLGASLRPILRTPRSRAPRQIVPDNLFEPAFYDPRVRIRPRNEIGAALYGRPRL